MPVNRAPAGASILAFEGARGELYQRIRRDGIAVLSGDRVSRSWPASRRRPSARAARSSAPSPRPCRASAWTSASQSPHVMAPRHAHHARLGGEFPYATPQRVTRTVAGRRRRLLPGGLSPDTAPD
jgi:hypothetical protein